MGQLVKWLFNLPLGFVIFLFYYAKLGCMSKKFLAGLVLEGLFIGFFALAVTYVFIPTFFPELVGTPEAWAYTIIVVFFAGLFVCGLIALTSLKW